MSALDLRGRAVITDGATATLRSIRGQLDAVATSTGRLRVAANALQTIGPQIQRATVAVTGGVTAAGRAVSQIIDRTKAFNEAKFGYGFARITDYIKDGRLDMAGWRADMNLAAKEARDAARSFGTLPTVTMKAREEVEKLGFKGNESKSIFRAALGLHLSEPTALASGEAAKYMGAVFRAYSKQREELARQLGKDANDPAFVEAYVKGLAAKAAVAGAESALGPAEIVEGMRQYAPQWAAMGIDYETALAMLAHGSNYGFRAPELGTAYKSMVTKIVNPTADGLRTMNMLGLDRQKYMTSAPVDPVKAAGRINSLVGGALGGKGWRERKATLQQMLETGYRQGITGTPEFQENVTQEVIRMLPRGYEGTADEVQRAVANATMTAEGGVKIFDLIKDLRDKGSTVGQIAQMFEGRHVARYTPLFQYYEKLIELSEKLRNTDGTTMDAVVAGRKESEAGKTDQLSGSWEELMVALEQTGNIVDYFKTKITKLNQALSSLPSGALNTIMAGIVGLAAVAGGGIAVAGLRSLGGLVGVGGRTAAGAAAAGAGGLSASARMIAGMSAAGAAVAGGGLLGRLGVRGALGVGGAVLSRLFWPAMIGMALYGAGSSGYDAYSKGGGWLEIIKRAGLGAAGGLFGIFNDAGGAPGRPNPLAGHQGLQAVLANRRQAEAAAPGDGDPGAASSVASDTLAAIEQMRATLAGVDLTAEGARIGQSLANGLRSTLADAVAAVREAGESMRAEARRIQLNTGPAMGGAR